MTTSSSSYDLLFELERQIARRADELARQRCENGAFPLESWLQAETQIWCEFDLQEYGSGALLSAENPAEAPISTPSAVESSR